MKQFYFPSCCCHVVISSDRYLQQFAVDAVCGTLRSFELTRTTTPLYRSSTSKAKLGPSIGWLIALGLTEYFLRPKYAMVSCLSPVLAPQHVMATNCIDAYRYADLPFKGNACSRQPRILGRMCNHCMFHLSGCMCTLPVFQLCSKVW